MISTSNDGKNYMDAHNTIPEDSIPRIFAGLRLHNTITFLFNNSSSVTYCTKPLTTVRGSGSPKVFHLN